MTFDIVRASEDINEINLVGNFRQFSKNLAPKYFRDLRIVDRHRDNIEARADKILRNIESGLTRLCFGFDAEHSDAF